MTNFKKRRRRFKPTQPASVPCGELLTKDEILMEYVNRHDTGLEGFARPVSKEVVEVGSLPKNDPVIRNMYLGVIGECYAEA